MRKFADMSPDIPTHDELDKLIFETLREPPELELSKNFTDDLLIRVEKQFWWREQLQTFGIKTGIVAGTLILVLLFLLLPGPTVSDPIFGALKNHWQIITSGILLILFIFFTDQVLLKYYTWKIGKRELQNNN
jgi:hypothetical protein